LGYRVTRSADSQEIARATSAIIFFDYTSHRPARTPLAFSKAFSQNSTE
jgi:acyl-CoA thioesterase FadM